MKVLLKILFVLHMPWRHPRGLGLAAQSILDVQGNMMSASRPVRFTTEERASGINRIGGWWILEPVWTFWSRQKSFPLTGDLKPASRMFSPAAAAFVSSPLSPCVPQLHVTFFCVVPFWQCWNWDALERRSWALEQLRFKIDTQEELAKRSGSF